MNRVGIFFFMLLISASCATDSNNKKGNATAQNQEINKSSILGKWKIKDENPILEGTIISEYFEDNTFQQNGEITSFQPSYTCQMTSHGTYSISNNILSYSYLAEKMVDCKPEGFQLMVNSYMGNKPLESGQNRILSLDEKTMVQEDSETKKKLTFTRVVE